MQNQIRSGLNSKRLASLQMYDLPHLHEANDTLWNYVRVRLQDLGLTDAPRTLARDIELSAVWHDENLLFAQACGLPLVTDLQGIVKVVATPRYALEGCRGSYHRSCIVVHKSNPARSLAELRGKRCVINDPCSNSGMNVLRHAIAVARIAENGSFFQSVEITGSHLQSLCRIAEGNADVAAIDCVSFAHARSWLPELVDEIKILDWTIESPCLPIVTAASCDNTTLEALRSALESASNDSDLAPARQQLFLDGFDILPEHEYQSVLFAQNEANRLGYPCLN